jgi:exosortase/archaeosortase family protein
MLSLFFGELYLLTPTRRALLVLSGFGMACLFNVGRTTLLTWVAARDGVDAIKLWHDPAGVTILVACFLGLWGIGTAMRKAQAARLFPAAGDVIHSPPPISSASAKAPDSPSFFAPRPLLWALCTLALWLVVVEIGVGLWYRHIEAGQAAQPTWQVAWPAEEAGFRSVPIPQKSTEMLHYDEAKQAQWTAANGTRWQLSWFYWKAGKAAGYLAKSHNPLVCMPAAGYQVSAISPPQFADIGGLRFPFRIYTFEKEGYTLYVLYSRWDDRAAEQSFATESPNRFNRLRSVWSGRGNHGQRVIGLALWGVSDAQGVCEQLVRQLQHVLVVNPL